MPAGETLHEQGKDGVARAKVWLEKTGRVEVNFSRYEINEAAFLTFSNLNGHNFSFDMGGVLTLDSGKVAFYGEVKNVTGEAGQGGQYRDFLAKCYRATLADQKPYHFMWITWHPFNVTTWTTLCTSAAIKAAVEEQKDAYCGPDEVDDGACDDLAERLWLIVLSKRQEGLSMSDEMLGEVRKALVAGVTP